MPVIKKKIPVFVESGYACDKCGEPIKMDYPSYDINRSLHPMRDFFLEDFEEFQYRLQDFILHQKCADDFFSALDASNKTE